MCGMFSFVYDKTTESFRVDVQALLCACEKTAENTITKDSINSKETEWKTLDSKAEKNVEERAVKTEENAKAV